MAKASERDEPRARRTTPWARVRKQLPPFPPGQAWLVGAGPGAPELLSLAGLHALHEATHIYHDALLPPALLQLASPAARLIAVGHRAGEPSRLAQTLPAMARAARAGGKIVRLKNGDPCLFGRGAEEAEYLWRARIPFRIVPGISSGLGGLAYAGLPLTHRAHNHAVTFLSGHAAPGSKAERLNWEALAQGAPVLVIYMGVRRAGALAARLMAAGRAPAEPAALVLDASLPGQSVHVGRLANLDALAAKAPPQSVGLIVVGPVVRLRARLNWFQRLHRTRRARKP